jgi:hypothetical protein
MSTDLRAIGVESIALLPDGCVIVKRIGCEVSSMFEPGKRYNACFGDYDFWKRLALQQ